jgi:hypothetical protein
MSTNNFSNNASNIPNSNTESHIGQGLGDIVQPLVFSDNARQELIQSLESIPKGLALTPVKNKRPLRSKWQNESPLSRESLKSELSQERCNGYGLRLGDVSGGKLALDVDGPSAVSLLKALESTHEPLPKSVTFTSGKDGRSQILFQIPEHYRDRFKDFNRKSITEFFFNGETLKCGTDENGKPIEELDFRYNGHQSVLPPSYHPETGSYHWLNSPNDCEVAIAPDWLCEFILKLSEPKKIQKNTPLKFEYSTFEKGDKNILNEWINAIPINVLTWYEWRNFLLALHYEGYSENEALIISQSSSKHTDKGFYEVWNHIKNDKSNNITGGTLYHLATTYGGWEPKKSDKTSTNNVIPFPPKTLKNPLEKPLRDLIDENLKGSQLKAKKAAIAKESGQPFSVVDNIYDDLLKESEREDDREFNKAELRQLIDIQNESISLYKFLPKEIATPIIALANRLNLRPEAFAMSLIAGLSSTLARGTKLSIDGSGWVVRPNIYFALLANSSQKKSPILNSMIKTALGEIQSKERADYETRLKEYEIEIEKYNVLKKKPEQLADNFPDGPPEKPVFKLKFTTNLTLEGVLKQLGQQERGLIAVCDELAGLFKSLNQYKSGGNDGEVIIELYDGGDMSIVRAKNDPVPLESPLFSMVGGVQPGVLKELFAKGDDNGNWARFCFVKQPLAATELNVDGGDIDISEPILSLYQNFSQIPLRHYKLTYQARTLYFEAHNRFEKARVASADHPMGNVWGKASGLIGKLAITLHGIKHASQWAIPPEEIDPDVIESAIALTEFLVNQSRSIYAELMGQESSSLPAHLLKLVEFIKRQPDHTATVRDIVNLKKAKDKSHAIELITELSDMGLGELIRAGKSLKFQLTRIDDKIDRIDDESTIELTTAKSLYSKDYKRIDDIDDKKNNFSKTIPTTHSLIEVNPENDNYSPKIVVNSVDSIVDNTQSNTQQGFKQSSIVVDSSSIVSSIEDPVVDCVVDKNFTTDFKVGDRVSNPIWGETIIAEIDPQKGVSGVWSFQQNKSWAVFSSLTKI